jgi:hypothetical protein
VLAYTAPFAHAQEILERPIPYPITPSLEYQQAVDNGTRTVTGGPGPDYWTNTATYDIEATLSPSTHNLRGQETIVYTNNSPDSLQYLVLHLRQNLHREGAIRNRSVEITGGMHLSDVRVEQTSLVEHNNGRTIGTESGYVVDGAILYLTPSQAVAPDSEVEISLSWNFEVPSSDGAPRMGREDNKVYFLGYWYPQMAVYDDVQGWDTDPYMGNGEFYMGYADYDVRFTVPQGWLVGATGQLENPADVLAPNVRDRLNQLSRDSVRTLVGADERNAGTSTTRDPSQQLTWHFQATNVRDFAIGTSNEYIWKATRATAGDVNGDGSDEMSTIHVLYRPEAQTWSRAAEFSRFSIEHLSDRLVPYPYPQMTSVEGIIGGGMEYPMITLIGSTSSDRGLFHLTYHELSHMWFPMLVGSQETDYTWMDEGLVSFNTNDGTNAFFDEARAWNPNRQYYYYVAGTRDDFPVMRHGDRYPVEGPARTIASYNKPALVLHALRGILGDETFFEAYRTYTQQWRNKHPYPHDLFNTFEEIAGRDLDWFWSSMLYETWTVDLAVESVDTQSDSVRVTIRDEGRAPMPVSVKATYADGSTETKRVPVSVWLKGKRETTLAFPSGQTIRVELDPENFLPDVNRTNNRWQGDS